MSKFRMFKIYSQIDIRKKIIRRWEKESRQSQFHRNDLREESALGTINCPKNYNFHCKRRSCQRSTASHARLSTEYVYN
ncbi:hypothetical protein V6N13_007639 [Hibiscus sabdariffa]